MNDKSFLILEIQFSFLNASFQKLDMFFIMVVTLLSDDMVFLAQLPSIKQRSRLANGADVCAGVAGGMTGQTEANPSWRTAL